MAGATEGSAQANGGFLREARQAPYRTVSVSAAWLAEKDNLCNRERFGVSDGDERRAGAERGKTARGRAVQLQLRWPTPPDHFDVTPPDPPTPSGAERLHGGFLHSKPAGQMRRRPSPSRGIGDLAVGEHATEKSIAESLQALSDAGDIGCVEPDGDNGHGCNAGHL